MCVCVCVRARARARWGGGGGGYRAGYAVYRAGYAVYRWDVQWLGCVLQQKARHGLLGGPAGFIISTTDAAVNTTSVYTPRSH